VRKVKDLLRLSRGALEMFEATQRQLLNRLQKEPQLVERLAVLKSIRGCGRCDGTDLGAGNLLSAAVPVHRGCRELLWPERDAIRPRSIFGEPQSRRRHIAPG
jgi:hypothetical protein